MSLTPVEPTGQDWKTRTYAIGALFGVALGLLASYLFARAAEENSKDGPPQIPTTQILGISLAVLGLIRQIAEMGRPRKK